MGIGEWGKEKGKLKRIRLGLVMNTRCSILYLGKVGYSQRT